jgi:demethylmenaquinone methyltransferase/2-methoxy-6-polyprenyl-1,4-benzoquinol methylase
MIDTARVQRRYRRLARIYDWLVAPTTARLRREAVARLSLRPGDSVLDLGCGTGLSLPLLVEAVGAEGRVVGAELSPEMLARARQKVEAAGWANVTLVQTNAEELDLGEQFDGILAYYTHDIMTSPVAVERAAAHLKPGDRFVAGGAKWATGWGAPANVVMAPLSLPFVTNRNLEAARHPWANLERLIGRLEISEQLFGTSYLAMGVKAPPRE